MSRIMNSLKSFNYVYLVVLSGNFLALSGDASVSWSSPMIPKLSSDDPAINPIGRPITTSEKSWIGSLTHMGAMVGLFPFGLLSDYIGRRPTLLILGFPHFSAFILYAFSHNIHLFYLGRFLNGLSVGAGYVVLPMYIAEISSDATRGLMLVSYTVFSSFGGLLSFLIGPYFSIFWFNITLAIFPAVYIVTLYVLAPESPYFYVQKNNFVKAKRTLRKLRPHLDEDEIENEIASVRTYLDTANRKDAMKTLRAKSTVKVSVIALILNTLPQFSGQAAFLAYNEPIFQDAGISLEPHVASITVGTVSFISSFIGVSLVDKKGRKFLLYCSCFGLIISEFILASYYKFKEGGVDVSDFSLLSVFSLMLFMFMFNVGVGPLPFTITSEILPMNVKFLVATTAGFFSWMASFLVTNFFDDINNQLGNSGTIFLFSGFVVFLLIFTKCCVPETKGISLHGIQTNLAK